MYGYLNNYFGLVILQSYYKLHNTNRKLNGTTSNGLE